MSADDLKEAQSEIAQLLSPEQIAFLRNRHGKNATDTGQSATHETSQQPSRYL